LLRPTCPSTQLRSRSVRGSQDMFVQLIKEITWCWWCMPVIPDSQKMEEGGCGLRLALGKRTRPYLKNKLKAKRPGCG
jgi:hypothetical protein